MSCVYFGDQSIDCHTIDQNELQEHQKNGPNGHAL